MWFILGEGTSLMQKHITLLTGFNQGTIKHMCWYVSCWNFECKRRMISNTDPAKRSRFNEPVHKSWPGLEEPLLGA